MSAALSSLCLAPVHASSIALTTAPISLVSGQSYDVVLSYQASVAGIVQIQLMKPQPSPAARLQIVQQWRNVPVGSGTEHFTLLVPEGTAAGTDYLWQALLYNTLWSQQKQVTVTSVTVTAATSSTADTDGDTFTDAWETAHGFDPNVHGDVGIKDSDGDGDLDVLEIFQGTNRNAAGESYGFKLDGGAPTIFAATYRADSSQSAVSGTVKWSTDLATWNLSQATAADGVTVRIDQVPTHEQSDYSLIKAIPSITSGAASRLFLRLELSEQTVARSASEWFPAGSWDLEWSDEFSGTGTPAAWYPMLGYSSDDYAANSEKGLRWTGTTEDTAWMYSTRSGNHWLTGDGQLVIRAIADKAGATNANGTRVKTAYLLSGYPDHWDKTEPGGVKWAGKFVSPKDGPLYICARVRTDQVVGYSTWFAFWLFSETRAYDGTPADGTEVDVIEIVKGASMANIFNVANHWAKSGGSESKQFNTGSTPTAGSFVDVNDANFHTYGIEWSQTEMKCTVDGKLYYTFTSNIPSDPVDMMMLLTMEFQPNAWQSNQGDGRTAGPYVSDTAAMREMSRAVIDYVRVYRKQ